MKLQKFYPLMKFESKPRTIVAKNDDLDRVKGRDCINFGRTDISAPEEERIARISLCLDHER